MTSFEKASTHWIGQVPRDWSIVDLRRVARLESGHTPSRQNPEYWVPSQCTLPWFSLADVWQLREGRQKYLGDTAEKISELGMANSAARLLPSGTVVLSRTASVGFAGIMPRPMATTQDFANWVPSRRLNPEYLLYAFWAMRPEFERLSMGSTHKTIYMPDIRALSIPLPPLRTQAVIVAFLDRKTAAIDALIDKKQRMFELLHEECQALITQAVTKGLHHNVPMKDSGIEWIGVIPAHWKVTPLRKVAKLESGHTPSRKHPEYWIPEECVVPWFSLADVWQLRDAWSDHVFDTTEKISAKGIANSGARLLPAETVMLSRTASVGFAGIMGVPMATTQDFVNWVCGPRILPMYLLYVFRSMKQEFSRLMMGSTHQTIYMPAVRSFQSPLPPIEEQHVIVKHIQLLYERHRLLNVCLAQQLDRLREYRRALITAAVTGKLDIPTEPA